MTNHKYTNSLIKETSPYLLQHAHNPVNWKAWNNETLEQAKKENKLILISIGYSSCHWCHVMEHESFEDEEVAVVMNQHFINIKIDREERPDIDQIYMNAVQLLTGRGGWPLNCVALPDGRPVWGGTYLPKDKWINVLEQLSKMYRDKPGDVINYAERLTEGVQNSDLVIFNNSEAFVSEDSLHVAVENWKQYMDFDLGGRRGAPKFPLPNNYQFLLRYAFQTDNNQIMDYVNTSLTKMAYGGIFDQIGGGFARYAVDNKWHVPHFEKMLYDNGQLVSLFSEAYQVTNNELYKETVYETLKFCKRELLNEDGAFYSSLDADSLTDKGELVEGAFYVWNKEELEKLLKEDFELFSHYYNVNYYGFWEDDNYVLIRKETKNEVAKKFKISKTELESKIELWKEILLKFRSKRSKPRLDDKILTTWNALMLKGCIDAYKVFNEEEFLQMAVKNAKFLYSNQLQTEGNLNRNFKNGKSTINGYLIDYATLIDAYISLYEVTFKEFWLITAKQLTDYTFDHFFDAKSSMFYFTSNLDPDLITRKIEVEDNVIPASNSIMANNLFKLSHHFSNSYYLKVSRQMLKNVIEKSEEHGSSYSNWLQLLCNFSGGFYEIAISGKEAKQKLYEINQEYIPNKLIAASETKSNLPLMQRRFIEEKTQIFVCTDGACQIPTEDVSTAKKQIITKF
jgi:uncharacterized protein YyaL (SSP411 family)